MINVNFLIKTVPCSHVRIKISIPTDRLDAVYFLLLAICHTAHGAAERFGLHRSVGARYLDYLETSKRGDQSSIF